MELLPLAIEAAAPLVKNAITSLSTPSTSSAAPDFPDHTVVSTQPLPPTPLYKEPSPVRHPPGLAVPFVLRLDESRTLNDDKGQAFTKKVYARTLTGFTEFNDLILRYRYATVSSLELVISPLAASYKWPATIYAVWTPADVVVTAPNNILGTPGAGIFTVGGLYLNNQGILPCDLSHINPIIKAPVSYLNTPRLHYNMPGIPEESPSTVGQFRLMIRGTVHLSVPIAVPFS